MFFTLKLRLELMELGKSTIMVKLAYISALALMSILLYGINQGYSQINDNQSITYENKDLGIRFQYPSNWIKIDE